MLPPRPNPRRPFTLCRPFTTFIALRDYRKLDPRPCPSSYPALFTRRTDRRFSGSDCRPTISATALLDTWAHPRAPDSRIRSDPPAWVGHRTHFCVLSPVSKQKPSPYEEDCKSSEPRQPFLRRAFGLLQAQPLDTPQEAVCQSRRRLRATPKPSCHLRWRLLDKSAGLHGPRSLERRTFLAPLLPQKMPVEGSPPRKFRLLEHP